MALITCPECGQQVSDKAKNCIHCGVPIAVDNSTKIKLYHWAANSMKATTCKVEITSNGKTVWTGNAGSVAVFEIPQKANIHILANNVQANGPFVYGRDVNLDFVVEPGKRYEIYLAQASFLNDMSKGKYAIRLVDVIDSGN